MADAEPDFSNYMEQLQAMEAEEARDEAMFNAHAVSPIGHFPCCPALQYRRLVAG
jgi:hypothetical protein